MNKRYYWKDLTSDGLLKEPDDRGAYYDRDSLNPCDGFESEGEALGALSEWEDTDRFVLIVTYRK